MSSRAGRPRPAARETPGPAPVPTSKTPSRVWARYTTKNGKDLVRAEIDGLGLSREEQVHLVERLSHVADLGGCRCHSKPLGDGVFQVRHDGDRRSFRVTYGRAEADGRPVLLHLSTFEKRADRAARDIREAKKRWKEWKRRAQR